MARLILVALLFGSAFSLPIKQLQPVDGCACEKFSCGCCLYMDVPQIWLNDTACINFAYQPEVYGISFVITIDDKALINETISAKNPPPICFPVPLLEDFVDGCIHFTDLNIKNTSFHGCVSLELRMWWVYVVAEVSLGCFDTDSLTKHTFDRKIQEFKFSNVAVDNKYKYDISSIQKMYANETKTQFGVGMNNVESQNVQAKNTPFSVLVHRGLNAIKNVYDEKYSLVKHLYLNISNSMFVKDQEHFIKKLLNISDSGVFHVLPNSEKHRSKTRELQLNKSNSFYLSSILFYLVVTKACMSFISHVK